MFNPSTQEVERQVYLEFQDGQGYIERPFAAAAAAAGGGGGKRLSLIIIATIIIIILFDNCTGLSPGTRKPTGGLRRWLSG